MKPHLILLIFLALCGCNDDPRFQTPFAAYRQTNDALVSFSAFALFDIYPCRTSIRTSGHLETRSVPFVQCYKTLPPHRYRGIWLDQHETSRFFDGAATVDAVKTEVRRRSITSDHRSEEWLYYNEKDFDRLLPPRSGARLIAIDFVGRRAAYRGSYGWYGFAPSAIMVERIIAAKVIYQSPEAYLEDDVDKGWRTRR